MSDCCSKSNKKISLSCPQCESDCRPVTMRTVYQQVRFPENQQIAKDNFYYCSSRECPTAYFSESGYSTSKSRLISQQAFQNDTLCYCFDITAEDYQSALQSHHADAIKGFVIQRTKLVDCACEIRNPAGLCCLAKFKQLEKDILQSI